MEEDGYDQKNFTDRHGSFGGGPCLKPGRASTGPSQGPLEAGRHAGCFGELRKDLEEVCRMASKLGLKGIDLVGPGGLADAEEVRPAPHHGARAAAAQARASTTRRTTRRSSRSMREAIERAAAAGAPNVIVLAGNRRGIADEAGHGQHASPS